MFMTLNPDRSVERRGIETPKGTRIHSLGVTTFGGLLDVPVRFIAVAVPAQKVYAGNYLPRENYPAEIVVYRILEDDGDGNLRVQEALTLPTQAETKITDLS